jgi:RHS repeat-associated protein
VAPLTGDPNRFAGKQLDAETALHYFDARYYRQTWGRFTSVDPLHVGAAMTDPQQWNRYAHARNNPLKYADPTGLSVTFTSGISCPVGGGIEGCPGEVILTDNGWECWDAGRPCTWVDFETFDWMLPGATNNGTMPEDQSSGGGGGGPVPTAETPQEPGSPGPTPTEPESPGCQGICGNPPLPPVVIANPRVLHWVLRMAQSLQNWLRTPVPSLLDQVVRQANGSIHQAVVLSNAAKLSQSQAVQAITRAVETSGRHVGAVVQYGNSLVLTGVAPGSGQPVVHVAANGVAHMGRATVQFGPNATATVSNVVLIP